MRTILIQERNILNFNRFKHTLRLYNIYSCGARRSRNRNNNTIFICIFLIFFLQDTASRQDPRKCIYICVCVCECIGEKKQKKKMSDSSGGHYYKYKIIFYIYFFIRFIIIVNTHGEITELYYRRPVVSHYIILSGKVGGS